MTRKDFDLIESGRTGYTVVTSNRNLVNRPNGSTRMIATLITMQLAWTQAAPMLVTPGMSIVEVVAILGKPDAVLNRTGQNLVRAVQYSKTRVSVEYHEGIVVKLHRW